MVKNSWRREQRRRRHKIVDISQLYYILGAGDVTLPSLQADKLCVQFKGEVYRYSTLPYFFFMDTVYEVTILREAKTGTRLQLPLCLPAPSLMDALFGTDIEVMATSGVAAILCLDRYRIHRWVSFPSPATPLLIRSTTCPPWKVIWIINLKHPKIPFATYAV